MEPKEEMIEITERSRVQIEDYRYYLRAAVLVGMLAGAALGALNLTWIAAWGCTRSMPQWDWWPALIQAHGNAQLYGWTGLFIRAPRNPASHPIATRFVASEGSVKTPRSASGS
jgi:hypothetical protein